MDRKEGSNTKRPGNSAGALFWDGDPWPFQRLSDLQLVDKNVTLNHLAPVERMESLRCWKIQHIFVGRTFLHGHQTWMFGGWFYWWFAGSILIFWGVMLKVEFQLSILPKRSFTMTVFWIRPLQCNCWQLIWLHLGKWIFIIKEITYIQFHFVTYFEDIPPRFLANPCPPHTDSQKYTLVNSQNAGGGKRGPL